jgi:hypothetical protein
MQKREVVDTFLDFFHEKNYLRTNSSELITADNTILFTNDTIVPWKKYLEAGNIPYPGIYMKQPCLRTKVLRDTITEEIVSERQLRRFIGYFNSLGILTHPSQGTEVQMQIGELLLDKYKISTENLCIVARSDMNFLNEISKNIQLSFIPQKNIYYEWKYGIPGITGLGATFCILQNDNSFKEIGQLIEIKKDNKVIGYEFGFGVEAFLSRKNKEDSYKYWTISSTLPEKYHFKILLDTYSCFGTVCSVPQALLKKQHVGILYRLAKNIAILEDMFNIDGQITENSLNMFVLEEFGKSDLKDRMHNILDNERRELYFKKQNIYFSD